jgi:cytolysin (calcineurin-like family phosphatase)
MNMVKKRKWQDMSSGQKTAALVLGSIQVALAVTAWRDLAKREVSEVRGSKARWAVVIGVNFIGPVLYFLRGRKR